MRGTCSRRDGADGEQGLEQTGRKTASFALSLTCQARLILRPDFSLGAALPSTGPEDLRDDSLLSHPIPEITRRSGPLLFGPGRPIRPPFPHAVPRSPKSPARKVPPPQSSAKTQKTELQQRGGKLRRIKPSLVPKKRTNFFAAYPRSDRSIRCPASPSSPPPSRLQGTCVGRSCGNGGARPCPVRGRPLQSCALWKTIRPFSTSPITTAPGAKWPSRTSRLRGSRRCFWMARLRGRAP